MTPLRRCGRRDPKAYDYRDSILPIDNLINYEKTPSSRSHCFIDATNGLLWPLLSFG